MDAVERKRDKTKDLDDSGCVQDDDSFSRKELESDMEETQLRPSMIEDQEASIVDEQRAGLLDLSDDVLLCILKYCSPRDLKALGFTCARLGALILDHTLWTDIRVGHDRFGIARMKWLSEHALNPGTKSLQLCGLAREAQGCLGYINRCRPITMAKDEINNEIKQDDLIIKNADGIETCRKRTQTDPPTPMGSGRQPAHLHVWSTSARQLPRFSQSPYWPKEAEEHNLSVPSDHGCLGPVFTLTPSLLTAMRTHCQLHTLHLLYANINCTMTPLALFPKSLKSLSLRGTKCYNMAMDSSFLSKINDVLPGLEHVDVSECEWVDPAILIPLSKLPNLKRLEIRQCHRMCEFIAYGSLAARYGFKKLESLDFRGSPLGESEVSPFAFVSTLQELYLSSTPSPVMEFAYKHTHYRDEPRGVASELEDWEKEVPDYYKAKQERPLTPEPDLLPRNTTMDSPHVRPANIFTVTLSRNNAPVIEHIPPENLHQFLMSQNMIAVNVSANTVPEFFRNGAAADNQVYQPEVENPAAPAEQPPVEDEPPIKKQKTDKGRPNNGGLKEDGDIKQDGASTSKNEDKSAVPLKKRKLNDVNIEASTSKSVNIGASTSKDNETPSTSDDAQNPKEQSFVKFRRNEPPIVVSNDDANDKRQIWTRSKNKEVLLRAMLAKDAHKYKDLVMPGTSKESSTKPKEQPPVKVDKGCDSLLREIKRSYNESVSNNMRLAAEQLNNERYNLLQQAEAEAQIRPEHQEGINRPINIQHRIRMSYLSNLYYTPASRPVDPTTLVTDACIKTFGLSDNDDVNYVHIGPHGAFFVGRGQENGAKPPKSNLRKLVCNNYSGITNSSLDHLATAAPLMEYIDFRGTKVTAEGVAEFKGLRPDCVVVFDELKKT